MSRTLTVVVTGNTAGLEKAFGRSAVASKAWGDKISSSGRKVAAVGKTMTSHFTVPILAAGAASVDLAVKYDTAMNHVQALTGASAKQTKQWSDQILSLAPKIGQTPQQLAEALYFVASSGAKVNQVLPITVAAAKDAAAGMGDAQTVAQLLTSAMNAYGAKALSAAKASDILTESVKVGKAEPAELAANLGKVIPIAQAMGVSFAEVAAATAELTNTGLDAAQAATGVRAALTGLLKPAKGTATELHNLGLSVKGVQEQIAQKGLLATLDMLKAKVGDNKTAMAKLFPNVRALTAFLALTGKNSKAAAAALDKVRHSTGAADQAFRTAAKGPGFRLHAELAQLEVVGIRLGNTLLPIVLRIAGAADRLVRAFSGLSKSKQDMILMAAGGVAALGPLLTVVGNLARVVGVATKAFRLLVPAEAEAGAAAAAADAEVGAGGLAGSMGLLGPAALVAAGGMAAYWKSTQPNVKVSSNLAGAVGRVSAALRTGHQSAVSYDNIITRSISIQGAAQRAFQKVSAAGIDQAQMLSRASQNANTFQQNMGRVAAQALVMAAHVAKSNPILASNYRHTAAVAQAAELVSERIKGIPTFKQITIQMNIDELINKYVGATPGQPTGSPGNPHGNTRSVASNAPSIHIHMPTGLVVGSKQEISRVVREAVVTGLRTNGPNAFVPTVGARI